MNLLQQFARFLLLVSGGLFNLKEYDGFMDGMREFTAVIETRTQHTVKLKWNDGNQDFMKRCRGGGWASIHAEDFR